MPSCVFKKCTNYDCKANKSHGISYHVFPTNEVRHQEWAAIVRIQRREYDWMPSKGSRICSNHFDDTYKYISEKGRTQLKKNAVPFIEEDKYPKIYQNTPISPTSLDDFSISEDIFESPIQAALKNRIRKLTLKTKQLQRRNKMLNQQNKRLKKRVTTVTDILKHLKKKTRHISKELFPQLNLKAEVLD